MLKKESQNMKINSSKQSLTVKQHSNTLQKLSQFKISQVKAHLTTWLEKLPTEERYLAVKFHSPDIVYALRKAFRRVECQKGGQNNSNGKAQTNETRKFRSKVVKIFLEGLVLISDEKYLDSIGFDFNLIDSPQKLFDSLNEFCEIGQNQVTVQKFIKQQNFTEFSVEALNKCKSKQQIAIVISKVLRNQLFFNFIYQKQIEDLQKEKNHKKQYTLLWKNSVDDIKHKILYLGHNDIKQLIMSMIDKKMYIPKHEQLEKQINDLMKMQKNEFCNRIFKTRLKKSYVILEDYHELVYEIWKQQVDKKKKRKNKKNKKRRTIGKEKRNKSLGVESNQTNETQSKYQTSKFINIQHIIQMKLKNDIISYSDKISQEANEYYDRKVEAFSRMEYLLGAYFQTQISLFGSCACGLAIKNSDIDIAIDQSFLCHFQNFPESKRVSIALDYLAEMFATRPWIKNLKVIRTASIPIINLTIDTSTPIIETYMAQYDYCRLNSSPNKGLIEVDLTIQTKSPQYGPSHLGIISTKQMCQWLQEINCLHEITIILKYYLTMKSLSDTYKGGLKTYTLIVMIIAYILDKNLQQNGNIEEILEGLTKFYGYEFDEMKQGIDISNGQAIFYEKVKNQINSAALEIKDPINGKVMTKSCYLFGEIKLLMRQIYIHCFQKNKEMTQQFCSTLNPKSCKLSIQKILEQCKQNLPKNPFDQIAST